MTDITIGSVGVEVVPSARGFGRSVSRQVNPEAARIGQEFGRLVGAAAEREMASGVREGLRSGSREANQQGSRQGSDYGGSFARALKTRLEAAFRSLPEIELRADSSGADREITAIRDRLLALRDRRIGIDIDAGEASRQVEELENHLRLLAQQSPEVDVRIDAGRAAAELARFQAEVNRLDGQSIDVDVDVDTARASAQLALLRGQALGSSAGFSALLASALLLGPALIPIAAAGAGAMAAIATGALAAAGGLGVLILALAPVIAAVQAVQQAHDKSAAAARGSTSAHLQMASAMDAVRTAQQGLKSAEEDARDARVRAAQQIEDAERSLADAKRQAVQDVIDADRRVVEAERSVAVAQRDALDAQRELADARRQAARDAEDLAARVSGGVLDQRDAELRLAEARERLREVEADPQATELQRQRAQLAVDQAMRGLQEQIRENARLAEEKAAADKAGVEGSDRVREAQDRVRQSQQALGDAQEAVTRAVEDAAERRRVAAERVEESQRRVTQATRDAEVQQRKSAESIAAAQQAVVAAQRGVQQASQSAGATGGAAMDTVRAKMDALSPAGQRFVTFITDDLLPALRPLGDAAQTAILPGLQTAIEALLPALPSITRLIESFGGAVADLAGDAVESLSDPVWQEFFSYLQEDGPDILRDVGHIVIEMGKAFAGLVTAFAPVSDKVIKGLLTLAGRFADFAANSDPGSPLGRFIAYIQDIGPQVADAFLAIAGAVGHILESLAPLAPIVLTVVTGFANLISALPAPVVAGIVVGIGALAASISVLNAGLAITSAVLAANPVVLIVGGIVVAIAALVAAIVILWKNNETFRQIVVTVWTAVRDFIRTAAGVIVGVFRSVVAFVRDKLGPVFTFLWQNVIRPAWTGIRLAIDVAWVAIQIIFKSFQIALTVLGVAFGYLWRTVIVPVWNGIKTTISTVWETGIKPILTAVGDFIEDHVAPAFARGVQAIAKAWDGVKAAAKAPVRFVVDTVINSGIIDTFNKVAGFFKVDPIDHVQLPKGFATGGYVSGPGGPREDKIPAMLSNGEFVINAASVKRIGLDFLRYVNDGGSFGGDPGGVARFAKGGLVEDTMRWLPSVDPLPYVWGGVGPYGFDCSGLVGEVFARVSDKIHNTRYFTTSSNLGQFGFAPGPGMFSVGVNPGQHMAGNLGGLGFEARSTATGIFVGPSAKSPTDFSRVFHLSSMPGGSKTPDGISLMHPIDSAKALFSGLTDGFDFTGPWADLVIGMPKALVSAAGDFISDAIPGFADGGLVRKYDDGGWLPPGLSTVVNLTGKPEPVLTAGQWDSMRRGGGGDGPATVQVTQNITNPVPERPGESLATGLRRVALFGLIPKGA
jgi:hypothetical protein